MTVLFGVYRAVVKANLDPEGRRRLRVEVPGALTDETWATPGVPGAGDAVPTIGSTVWVTFDRGDPSTPLWISAGS